ncbi:MAG TPA: GNAT family N-acetyltransferase [Bacteroidota bacterium]|nr:GNAT family N-acetyltransferase [Bacteroidota bacterium]
MAAIEILPLQKECWREVERIYLEGIATKNATFETQAPSWEAWDVAHRSDCRIVAKIDNRIVGWAALSPVSRRSVYAGVAEISIYVDKECRHQGVGSALMKAMIEQSEAGGVWTLQAGIFPENIASIELHKKHGFRILGIREKIGMMDGCWRDLAFLERRSKQVVKPLRR